MAKSIFNLFEASGNSTLQALLPVSELCQHSKELVNGCSSSSINKLVIKISINPDLVKNREALHHLVICSLMASDIEDLTLTDVNQWLELTNKSGELPLAGKTWIYFDVIQAPDFYKLDIAACISMVAYDNKQRLLQQIQVDINHDKTLNDGLTSLSLLMGVLPYQFKNTRALLDFSRTEKLSFSQLQYLNEAFLLDGQVEQKIQYLVDAVLSKSTLNQQYFNECSAEHETSLNDQLDTYHLENIKLDFSLLTKTTQNYFSSSHQFPSSDFILRPNSEASAVISAVLASLLKTQPERLQVRAGIFLLTAGVIGLLFDNNHCFSAKRFGVQGTVGVACSMSAAGLTAAAGGTSLQIISAAEMAIEHFLGLNSQAFDDLSQLALIERNTLGALKAIEVANLAIQRVDQTTVDLDDVITTMLRAEPHSNAA